MEPSAQERERMKSYSVLLPPEMQHAGKRSRTRKKTKEEEKKVERTKTHCRTRGWWSIVVVSLVLFAVSVISLVYFKRENERGKYYSSTYIKRGAFGLFSCVCCKEKKRSVDQKKKKKNIIKESCGGSSSTRTNTR
jgi:transcription elongation factor Elf1